MTPLFPRRGNRKLKMGIALLVAGTGPLLAVILAAKLGLTSNPDPNPIGLGLLAFVTFWPAVIIIVIGLNDSRRERADPLAATRPLRTTSLKPDTSDHPPS